MEWQSSLFSQKPRKKSRTVVLTDSDDEKHKTSVGTFVLPISSLALFVPLFPILSSPSLPLSSSLSHPLPFFPIYSSLFLYFLYLPFSVFSTGLLFSSLFSPLPSLFCPIGSRTTARTSGTAQETTAGE